MKSLGVKSLGVKFLGMKSLDVILLDGERISFEGFVPPVRTPGEPHSG
jgi:hypothetical protein